MEHRCPHFLPSSPKLNNCQYVLPSRRPANPPNLPTTPTLASKGSAFPSNPHLTLHKYRPTSCELVPPFLIINDHLYSIKLSDHDHDHDLCQDHTNPSTFLFRTYLKVHLCLLFLFIFSLYSHIYILILSHHIVIGSHTFLSNSQVTLILSLPPPLFVAVCYSPQTSPAISFSLQPKNYKIVQTYSMSRNISETPFRISLLQCFCECY